MGFDYSVLSSDMGDTVSDSDEPNLEVRVHVLRSFLGVGSMQSWIVDQLPSSMKSQAMEGMLVRKSQSKLNIPVLGSAVTMVLVSGHGSFLTHGLVSSVHTTD